jgi:hypothetical protein
MADEKKLELTLWKSYFDFVKNNKVPSVDYPGDDWLPITPTKNIRGPKLIKYLENLIEKVIKPICKVVCDKYLEICIWDPFREENSKNWALTGKGINKLEAQMNQYLDGINSEKINIFYYIYCKLKKEIIKIEVKPNKNETPSCEPSIDEITQNRNLDTNEKDKFKKAIKLHEYFRNECPIFIYYVPTIFYPEKEKGIGGLVYITDKKIDELCQHFKYVIESALSGIGVNYLFNNFYKQSIKSATASIMSRNMSHNIGSHVLSSLGKEGINAADDRILFQYLQQRMDYIAQISTEMPGWSSPVWFISDLMKRFYMQTHLLEYIGKSDGLGALNWKKEKGTGKIVINIKDDKNGKYIIKYSDKDELTPIIGDFQLAIPGGIVGLHAFYTIIENIIRNSAKHNWKKNPSENPGNLEITIEFKNNPDEEFVTFKIYDNVSDNNLKFENEENNGKCKHKKKLLHEKMKNIFFTDFIDESGKLGKENWGLAEMRISAGYLNHKTYQEIGFHKVEDKPAIIDAEPKMDNGIDRLAYQFKVPKPKDLLIMGDPDLKKEHENILKTSSIYIENRIDDKPYEHEIVVIFEEALNGEYKKLESMPGRIIIVNNDKKSNDLIASILDGLGIPKRKKSVVERKIVILEQLKYNEMKKDLTRDTDASKEKREDFKIELYKKWVENLITQDELFYLDLEGRDDSDGSDYLEEQMYQLIKNHVDKSEFLKTECRINNERDLENLRNEFRRMTTDEIKNLLSKHMLCAKIIEELGIGRNKIERIGKKLENKKNILKEFIFRDDDKIATVPETLIPKYKKGNISSWIDVFKALFPDSDSISKIKYTADDKKATICYKRHLTPPPTPKKDDGAGKLPEDIKAGYKESLSGSQFYFTMLYGSLTSQDKSNLIKIRKKKIILQLIENALIKCVIIDERAARFLSSSDVLKKKFELLRIQVPFRIHFDGKKEIPLTENHNSNAKIFSDENLAGYDIFIIHQGVLDKMGLNDKQKAGEFLEKIKESIPFVCVTSGRGKPENVWEKVKFLPFSSIDSFLLKEYPEKLLLIQSAMKLNLPKNGGTT